jgi:hypothetical protein
MKSPSNQSDSVETLVTSALDQSVDNLSDKALSDIAQARHAAMNALYNKKQKLTVAEQMTQWVKQPFPRVAFPVAAAVVIAVSLNYSFVDSVPAIPLAMMTEDVPTEDLTLLEDLEFVTWLAQNEQDVLL